MHPALIAQALTPDEPRALHLYVGGRDVTDLADEGSLVLTEAGTDQAANLGVQLIGRPGDIPELVDQSHTRLYSYAEDADLYSGYVVSRQPTHATDRTDYLIDVTAESNGSLLDSAYVPFEKRPQESLRARVAFFWGKYAGGHLSRDLTYIDELGGIFLDAAVVERSSLRQAIEDAITEASASADYRIDANGRLHIHEPIDDPLFLVGSLPSLPDANYPEGSQVFYAGQVYENTSTPIVGTPNDLGWTTLSDSVAVYYNGKTYVAYIRPENNAICVRVYDHATRTTSPEQVIIANIEDDPDTVDPHAGPAILARASDKRIMVFACGHLDKDEFYQWTSTNPEDISSGNVVNLHGQLGATNYTYPSVFQFASGRLMLVFRSHGGAGGGHKNAKWAYSVSDDDGATWSAISEFWTITDRGAYIRACKVSSTRVDFGLLDGNPGNDANVALYHVYTDGTDFFTSDGTQIVAAKPWGTANATLVYQPTGDDYVITSDIALDSGNPRIGYQVVGQNLTRWAKYAAGWSNFDVAAFAPSRSGVAIDDADANTIYAAATSPNKMTRYVTADGGNSWTPTAVGPAGSAAQRPKMVTDGVAAMKLVWGQGRSGLILGLSDSSDWTPTIDQPANLFPAPFAVTGAGASGPGEIAPQNLAIDYEAKEYINAVYIHGRTKAGSGLYIDQERVVAANGLVRTGDLDAPHCTTKTKAGRLAAAYLYRMRSKPRGSFSTESPNDGWQAGQQVRVVDPELDVDLTLPIVSVTRRLLPGAAWSYSVRFGADRPA